MVASREACRWGFPSESLGNGPDYYISEIQSRVWGNRKVRGGFWSSSTPTCTFDLDSVLSRISPSIPTV